MIEIIGSELNQWDDKRVVKVTNSVATHVHLANQGDSAAVVRELADSQALIPNYLLCTGKQLCVYAVANDVTIERKTFSVRKRERPEEYVYDDDQRNYIRELITDAQTATEAANQSAQNANEAADKANQAAKSWVIMGEVKGESVVIDDAIDQTFAGFRIFGKTTQDGVPSPDAPVELVSVENPTITVNEQSMLVPYTLRGIPVSSGGNYTDANGQQWVCDEVNLSSGMRIQRINTISLVNIMSQRHSTVGTGGIADGETIYIHTTFENQMDLKIYSACPSDRLPSLYIYNVDVEGIYIEGTVQSYSIRFRLKRSRLGEVSVKGVIDYLTENPISVMHILATPIETPLSEEELAAYKELHTYREPTTVSNDANAYMEIQYVMDAKKYIDSLVGSSAGLLNATVE